MSIREIKMYETSDGQHWSDFHVAEEHETKLRRDKYIPLWVSMRLSDGYTSADRNLVAEVLVAYGEELRAILEGRTPLQMPTSLYDVLDRLARGKPAFLEDIE